jgi:hypothetical protein
MSQDFVLRTTPGIRALCLIGFAAMTAQLLFLVEPKFANRILSVVWDKGVHAAYFAVMAFLLWVAASGRWTLAVWIAVVLIGAADEINQAFTPGRVCDFYDWLADALGAAAALIIVRRIAPFTRLAVDPRDLANNGG